MPSLPPLTHHEILELAEPFVRRGHGVDLPASDRSARELAFRPRPVEGTGLTGTLRLSFITAGRWKLTRTLTDADGLASDLVAEGSDPGPLIDAIDSVPALRQRPCAGGVQMALSHRLQIPQGAGEPRLVLQRAQARVAGLTLQFRVSGVAGYPAEFELLRGEPDPPALPEDFFAVLGRDWGRLVRVRRGWECSVRLRGAEPRRSTEAEACVALAVEHLVRTLAAPPAQFHASHRLARWRLALADTLPWAAGAAIVGVALWVQEHAPGQQSLLAVLANMAPPVLMGLFFLRREMPRMGLPRLPRRLAADAWQPRPPA